MGDFEAYGELEAQSTMRVSTLSGTEEGLKDRPLSMLSAKKRAHRKYPLLSVRADLEDSIVDP